jgi:hypothetical protein
MESLDRPYGDDETDYTTVNPELEGDTEERESRDLPTTDEDDHAHDPAFQAVEEAGGGVSEGFEVAEGQLVENIEDAPPADLTTDGFDLDDPGTDVDEDVADDVQKTLDDAEPGDIYATEHHDEARDATAEYGEPDEVDTTEVVRDPDEDGDDPGSGPGIAFDR